MPKAAPTIYSVHPMIGYAQAMLANMRAKTGRTVDEWAELARRDGPADDAGRRAWLKSAHGLGANHAMFVVERAAGRDAVDTDPAAYLAAAPGLVDALYAGPKAALRPIHDRLVELARSLGPDVRVCPGETIVALYREHVFAQVRPATRTRVDLGLALGDTPAGGRLIDTGGLAKKDRITHRVPLATPDEIDAEVRRWLASAYERAAPPA